MRNCVLLTTLALVVFSTPPEASADALARARTALADLRYEEAYPLFLEAWRDGDRSPGELRLLFQLAGQVAATLGDEDAAREHFARLKSLDPEARLPEGISPKIAIHFDQVEVAPLVVRAEVRMEPSPVAIVIVDSDPLGMVRGARATFKTPRGEPRFVEGRGRRRIELPLPSAPRLEIVIAALDLYENRLVELGTDTPYVIEPPEAKRQITITPPPPDPVPATGSRPDSDHRGAPLYAHWGLWGSLSVVSGGLGVFFGLRARSDQNELDALNSMSSDHDFREALAVEDSLRRNAVTANMAFALSGASAVAAVILAVVHRSEDDPPRARLTPGLAPGGVTLGLDVDL